MANCNTCGGVLSDPLSLASATASSCSCNTPLVRTSDVPSNSGCCVESVNGLTGAVVISFTEYTDADVQAYLSATAPIYLSGSGVISHGTFGTAGTYGNSTQYPIITVNATGHITGITLQTVAASSIGADLTAIEALTGTGYAIRTATNTWVLRSLTTASSSRITITNPAGTASATIFDLATTAVTPGTYGTSALYPVFTVDAYGRVTAASNQALPAVVIPTHTHYLGDLVNVSTLAGNTTSVGVATATVGDSLNWNGSQWVPMTPVTSYVQSTITLSGSWQFARCANTLDASELPTTVNRITKLADATGVRVVYINMVIYIPASELATFPLMDYVIGDIPAGYEPIDDVFFPVATSFTTTCYKKTDGTATFVGNQVIKEPTSVRIKPDRKMYLNTDTTSATFATLSGTNTVVLNIVGSYSTETITP